MKICRANLSVCADELGSSPYKLFGKFADADLLTDLETEHQQEIEAESQLRS